MEFNEQICALEAVLFASGESVSEAKLCTVLGVSRDELHELASALSDAYDFERRGIRLLHLESSYQMCSRADYAPQVRAVLETRRPAQLSQSALETLAIVAYKQPTTKASVEQIRGVDSGYTMNSLAEKGLIEDCGRLDVPGRPILYRTTERFLRAFGLSRLDQLPTLEALSGDDPEQLTIETAKELEALAQQEQRLAEEEAAAANAAARAEAGV